MNIYSLLSKHGDGHVLNTVWTILLAAGIIYGFVSGNLSAVTGGILGSTANAVQTLLSLGGAVCFWSGMMKIAERSGLSAALAALVAPVVGLLFPNLKRRSKAYEYVALNISANLLGLGSAATPMGLRAMAEMAADTRRGEASDSMCTLVSFNTAGPSLVPGSVVALRASLGSMRPDVIVGPAFFAACCAATTALLADRLLRKNSRGRNT